MYRSYHVEWYFNGSVAIDLSLVLSVKSFIKPKQFYAQNSAACPAITFKNYCFGEKLCWDPVCQNQILRVYRKYGGV